MPMSGSALGFWAWDRAPEDAGKFITKAACFGSNATEVECLRDVPAKSLVGSYLLYAVSSAASWLW